jgi:hypothetical protein
MAGFAATIADQLSAEVKRSFQFSSLLALAFRQLFLYQDGVLRMVN